MFLFISGADVVFFTADGALESDTISRFRPPLFSIHIDISTEKDQYATHRNTVNPCDQSMQSRPDQIRPSIQPGSAVPFQISPQLNRIINSIRSHIPAKPIPAPDKGNPGILCTHHVSGRITRIPGLIQTISPSGSGCCPLCQDLYLHGKYSHPPHPAIRRQSETFRYIHSDSWKQFRSSNPDSDPG